LGVSKGIYGYKGKILRINLSRKEFRVEEIPKEFLIKYVGGRGLAARYYYDEVPPDVHPLDARNKIFIMTGPLTGAKVFGGNKIHLITKSPLTNHYLCSNAGGYVGPELKFAGYDGLVIEGVAEKPTYVVIMDEIVEFRDASHLWGKLTDETIDILKKEVDPNVKVITIGPAGEKLVRLANVMVDNRSFGRGGAGAVMGSKKLKAIAIRGSGSVEVFNEEKLREILISSIDDLKKTTYLHTLYGSPQYLETLAKLGAVPFYNYQRTSFREGSLLENIIATTIRSKYRVSDRTCYTCPVACAKLCRAIEGPYKGAIAEPEYETVWAFGPQCGNDDMNVIIAANERCDKYGLDTISIGVVIGFAMECYERGLISKQDTGGLDLRFGNSEVIIEVTDMIAYRRGLGELLGNGVKVTAEKIGKDSERFAMHVKGMEMTGYEPRAFFGIALTYATSSRGACHNVGGWTIRDELLQPKLDRFAVEGKGLLVKTLQDVRGYIDSIGICTIPRRALKLTDEPKGDILFYVTGIELRESLLKVGERVYNLERLILNREGIRREDDTLPPRIFTEPLPDGMAKGKVITREMFDRMLNEYYTARGWYLNGVVSEEKLKELNIP